MRIYHFTIVFAILALAAGILCESRIASSDAEKRVSERYDIAFDRACDAAASVLRGRGEELTESVIYDARIQFTNSLCAYFGISAFSAEGRMLLQKVPVIAVTCPDGIYVGYIADESGHAVRKWTEKLLYSQISQEDIFEMFFRDKDINKSLTGRALKIELPDDDMGMFGRNAHETGFAAFYVKPGNSDDSGIYTYAASVSKIPKHYYINIGGDGYASGRYYHTESCRYKSEECMELNSRKECAEYGAFCCPECRDVLY